MGTQDFLNHVRKIASYVTQIAVLATCLVIGSVVQGQVPTDVQDDRQVNRYDIGIVSQGEVVPADKADVLVVFSARWCVFSARWCGPCQMLKPLWAELRLEGYRIVYIDTDTYKTKQEVTDEELARWKSFPHKRIPALYWYNSSTDEIVKEHVGLTTRAKVKGTLWKPSSSKVFRRVQ
jgi:thiol-disulfide isomerase/thioredoxin